MRVVVPNTSPRAGEQVIATVAATDQNGAAMTVGDPAWTSSASQVATVSASGVITTLAPGTVVITAAIFDVRGSVTLTVAPPAPGAAPVASVIVDPLQSSLEAGASLTLTAITRDYAGAPLSDREIAWSSSDVNVATVSPAGIVTAIGEGTAVIEALSETKRGTFAITVTPSIDSSIVISVPYPYPQSVVGDTVTAVAAVQSPYTIVSVTANVGGQNTTLRYGPIGNTGVLGNGQQAMGWSAKLNLNTLPFGPYALVITAIDDIGRRRVRAVPIVRNPTVSGGSKAPTSNK